MPSNPGTQAPTVGRFFVVAELRSKPTAPFETAMAGFGQAVRLGQAVWLLRAEGTAIGTIHNALLPQLGTRDSLFIAEAGSGRTTMFNLGPEIEARVRTLWKL